MYSKMLVPLDGSKMAEIVVPFANHLGRDLHLKVVFLHVCNESTSDFMCKAYVEHVAEGARKESGAARGATGKTGITETKGVVATGNAAEAILHYADEEKCDFILMATHGRSGIGRWIMGSVVHKVLTASQTPVLLIRAGAARYNLEKWPQNVLIPLDGSQTSESIIPHIEILAKQRNGQMEATLLKVCEPPDLLADYPEAIMALTWEEHVKQATIAAKEGAAKYLDGIRKRLETAGLTVQSEVILGERAAEEIITYIEKKPFDLIAMSTHGHSAARQWPYGHVADRLMHSISTPLFLVRPQELREMA